jgi:hypothetical protein
MIPWVNAPTVSPVNSRQRWLKKSGMPSAPVDHTIWSIESTMAPNRASPARSAASAATRSAISVLTLNQINTVPSESHTGWARVRKRRKVPSAPRNGKIISNGSPAVIATVQRAVTSGSRTGSFTDCQPQPAISAGVLPQ